MESKLNRRKAVDCKLLKKSETHKGYYKYMITIQERDGTIHDQPAYGKDMQGALSRLINTELTNKVEKKLETSTGYVFLVWILIMGVPVVFGDAESPFFLAYVFGSVGVLLGLACWWYNYINKKD